MLKPIILRIKQGMKSKEKTLLDYNGYAFSKGAGEVFKDAQTAVSDHEVKVLLFWAVISAGAALAYLIWIKYPRLRFAAAIIFLLSLVQFFGQWGGLYYLLAKIGLAPFK
jgi:hypothetical protein